MLKLKPLLLLLLVSSFYLSCNEDKKESPVKTVITTNSSDSKSTYSNFKKITSDKSLIRFSNTLTHDVSNKFNLFDYDFFYNGAGVGVEDLNNDGLKDIFFCGNQVENRLYLNKGSLVFEDITQEANINTNKNWSNGISFVDINNDGWMDIYVSQGGPHERTGRKNLLFNTD